MPYFAYFQKHEGQHFRLDTRIYLQDQEPGQDDHCVAAIIGKNPGSANGKKFDCLAPISLDGDKLLPFVRNRFQNAYHLADAQIPSGAYVRVWNLFYLCNKDLVAAVKVYPRITRPLVCPSESALPSIVWFAWGPPRSFFTPMQARFRSLKIKHPFYFDIDSASIVAAIPTMQSRVKHTQGLSADPIEKHLTSILGFSHPALR